MGSDGLTPVHRFEVNFPRPQKAENWLKSKFWLNSCSISGCPLLGTCSKVMSGNNHGVGGHEKTFVEKKKLVQKWRKMVGKTTMSFEGGQGGLLGGPLTVPENEQITLESTKTGYLPLPCPLLPPLGPLPLPPLPHLASAPAITAAIAATCGTALTVASISAFTGTAVAGRASRATTFVERSSEFPVFGGQCPPDDCTDWAVTQGGCPLAIKLCLLEWFCYLAWVSIAVVLASQSHCPSGDSETESRITRATDTTDRGKRGDTEYSGG
eukprot:TRINITY_DN92_c1_g1_i2.p1 TRINITY_DN92_c1_g1~~TRINITY_DN92_c1_g1_i2.p1  ORF type:complete len:268 (+),score=-27.78 TRINITY_DN92_c1_g1_i2:190-993(+)